MPIDHEIIYNVLSETPGLTIRQIAKVLKVRRGAVETKLASMKASGYCVCEDDEDRLYPHSANGQLSRWLLVQ